MDVEAQRAELAGLGIPDAQIAQMVATTAQREEFEVWPDNWDALVLFAECGTQWRWLAGFGRAGRTGLDYSGVESVLGSMPGITDRAQAMADVRVMERAALEVFNAA